MKLKLKKCSGCSLPRVIWRRVNGGLYCKQCAGRLPKHAPGKESPTQSRPRRIKQVSDKKQKLDVAYSVLRKKFLRDHPVCQAHLPGCKGQSDQVHHKVGKVGKAYLDSAEWLSCCFNCHQIIELNPELAKGLRLSKNRLNQS